ncbi:DUF4260 domain-containing protein [Methylomonas fluvii]|uniref:DUF4260 domain-containing protein n=1 Tax=Methylomonas fluvii TaxID=1854564 RepID=A0ABR9DJ29_9GAMM|nr:DUF4260 domain-containing protein [Methylomonas fluvii]MBD9363062.1 DUF4260 domain-containing protein [Methylomonas fluvii]CAD6876288.1 hypothetical protein [Methylomonas fluvii]
MSGETTGAVRVLLRLEGLCVLIAACLAYAKLSLDWSNFAIYFLVPYISLFGYFAGAKVGAISYNTAHSYLGAVASLVIGFTVPALQCAGLIWCAHIGFDRALGYGLKYPEGFGYTHLGRIGRFAAKHSEK